MVELLFEDNFVVTALDPDGKKFDKVSRIVAKSEQFDMDLQLDVNIEIYPLRVDEKFKMVLAPTLSLDGTPDSGYFTQGGRKSLADKFEYVMHGKLYKISEEGSGSNVKVLVPAIWRWFHMIWFAKVSSTGFHLTSSLLYPGMGRGAICFIWWPSDDVEGGPFKCGQLRVRPEAVSPDQEIT